MQYKQLSIQEQMALVEEIKETEAEMAVNLSGEKKPGLKGKWNKAWNGIFSSYAKYLHQQTTFYLSWGMDYDETQDCVMTGFMNAVREWNPLTGALSTIAGWKIKKEVQKCVQTTKRMIRLPENKENELISIAKAERELKAEFPSGLSAKEKRTLICEMLGYSEKKYDELMCIRNNIGSVSHLDAPVKSRNDEEGNTVGEFIAADYRLSGERSVYLKEQAENLEKVLSNLSPLEEYVYLSKLGIEKDGWHNIKAMSYEKIAESVMANLEYWASLGNMPRKITRDSMRVLFDKAESKVRNCEEIRYLDGYQDGKDIA